MENRNIEKLADTIELLFNKKKQKILYLPIEEIDGVKNINCFFEIYDELNGICFKIYPKFTLDGDYIFFKRLYKKNNEIKKEDLLIFINELLTDLPKLKLNKNGFLKIIDEDEEKIILMFEEILLSIECDNLKIKKIDSCCVCYEKTNTKTRCKHSLCLKCWSKLQIIDDEEDCLIISCPLCRENIYE